MRAWTHLGTIHLQLTKYKTVRNKGNPELLPIKCTFNLYVCIELYFCVGQSSSMISNKNRALWVVILLDYPNWYRLYSRIWWPSVQSLSALLDLGGPRLCPTARNRTAINNTPSGAGAEERDIAMSRSRPLPQFFVQNVVWCTVWRNNGHGCTHNRHSLAEQQEFLLRNAWNTFSKCKDTMAKHLTAGNGACLLWNCVRENIPQTRRDPGNNRSPDSPLWLFSVTFVQHY